MNDAKFIGWTFTKQSVDGVLGHSYFPRYVFGLPSRFQLLQRRNDLCFRVPAPGHALPLLRTRNHTQLRADLGEQVNDKGYFGEKLAAARQEIVRVWRGRAARLRPNTRGTDILGSLVLAGQLLQQDPNVRRKVLVIFSDMLESTPDLNFETASDLRLDNALNEVDKGRFLANLTGVEVYAWASMRPPVSLS